MVLKTTLQIVLKWSCIGVELLFLGHEFGICLMIQYIGPGVHDQFAFLQQHVMATTLLRQQLSAGVRNY